MIQSDEVAQSDVVIELKIVTARAHDQADRHGAVGVHGRTDVFLGARFYIARDAKAGIQHGSVGVAFGTLDLDSH
jgi:hypothetical protein